MKKKLQRFGASLLATAMVAQSVVLPASAETTALDPAVQQAIAESAASAVSTASSLPKFTSTSDLIVSTASQLAAQGKLYETEEDDAELDAIVQSKAGMSLAALENAVVDALYANKDSGSIDTKAYGLNKDEMASVMEAALKKYHLTNSITELGYQTDASGVVTAVTFTASSGFGSAQDETDSNEEYALVTEQAESYAEAYVAENADEFAADAAHSHTYGEPTWYWNDDTDSTHTHTWNETPDGYWTKTDDGWTYAAVYTCTHGDGYKKVDGTVTKTTTDPKPGIAGSTVYSAAIPAEVSPTGKEYVEPTTRTDAIDALDCASHSVPVVLNDDGTFDHFDATFNWEMTKTTGTLAEDYSNAELYYDAEEDTISVGAPTTVDWECTSITFTCAVCGKEVTVEPMMTMPVTVVVDQTTGTVYTNVGGTPVTKDDPDNMGVTLVTGMVSEDADGNAVSTGTWYDQNNNEVDASTINFTVKDSDGNETNPLLLYANMKTAVYVDDQGSQVTDTYDVSTAQMNYYYGILSEFNAAKPDYFGVSSPYWTSKNTDATPMGAVKVMCNMEADQQVPPTTMTFMLKYLPQGFMSYVMTYGEALLDMRDEAIAAVKALGSDADYVTQLLILHDWLAQVAKFDMGSMSDITSGGDNDAIQMTVFGALLGNDIAVSGADWGCVCLGYAAAYNYLVQNMPANESIYKNSDGTWKTADEVGDDAVVDFVQILYYCDTENTSVAGDAFGGGLFNNVHYFNAVKVNKLNKGSESGDVVTQSSEKAWYYVDVCYDDINVECMDQTRVETDGNLKHFNFLVSPSGIEGRYTGYYDYIDSLYDGYTYTKNSEPDKDDDGNYVVNNGEYHYSYTHTDNPDETRYTDTSYEDQWFSSAISPIYYDDNYFYYVDSSTNQNKYNTVDRSELKDQMSQMKEMMGDDFSLSSTSTDTLEARPRSGGYYYTDPDENSGSSSMSSMSSMSKTEDPKDIVLLYFNDKTSYSMGGTGTGSSSGSGMNIEKEVEVPAGTIYKIDGTEVTDFDLKDACAADADYRKIYPGLCHSVALYDGLLYFNIGNSIYTMNPTDSSVNEIKEYNTVEGGAKYILDNGQPTSEVDSHFPGSTMVVRNSSNSAYSESIGSFTNHPLAGLTVRDTYQLTTASQNGQTVITGVTETADQMIVAVATDLSFTYKDSDGVIDTDAAGTSWKDRKSYKTESNNYNPSYNRQMSTDEEKEAEKNKNEEFMWCANLIDTMDMKTLVSELSSGATSTYEGAAWCDEAAYTQTRTTNYGLNKGEKSYTEGSLPKGHTWEENALEEKAYDDGTKVYICADCRAATNYTAKEVTLPTADEQTKGEYTIALGTQSSKYIKDETVTLTLTKTGDDNDNNYTVTASYTADNAETSLTLEKTETDTGAAYTFTMPDAAVTVKVEANANTYKIGLPEDGTVAAAVDGTAVTEAAKDQVVTLTVTPAEGKQLAKDPTVTYTDAEGAEQPVTVTAADTANTYTFPMPAADVTVAVEYETVYTVKVDSAITNGSVTPDVTSAAEGDTVTLTVKADDGYALTAGSLKVTYDVTTGEGEAAKTESKTVEDLKAGETEGTYTFTMPAADVTVTAAFEAEVKTYSVTVTESTNGTVTPSTNSAKAGDTITLTVAPDTGYELDTLTVTETATATNTVKVEVADDKASATFTMPAADVTVTATFKAEAKATYTIASAVTPEDSGTISILDASGKEITSAAADDVVTVKIAAADNYENGTVAVVAADADKNPTATTVTAGSEYTFVMPASAVTVTATFTEKAATPVTYTVTFAEAKGLDGNCTTDPAAATGTGVEAGTQVTVTVPTTEDYECPEIMVNYQTDTIKANTDGTFTFTMPAENVTVTPMTQQIESAESLNSARTAHSAPAEKPTALAVFTCTDEACASAQFVTATVVQNANGTYTGTASFNNKEYTKDYGPEITFAVTIAETKNGTVSAKGATANIGDTVALTVTPDDGYELEKLTVVNNDTKAEITVSDDYTFIMPGAAVTVTAAFAKKEVTPTPTPGYPSEPPTDDYTGWVTVDGKDYWYENGVKQGTTGRGKEIYDEDSDAWYWLDAVQGGAKAVSKDVYQESAAGEWADQADGTGKWVRYDENGHMIKGWQTTEDGVYYFDPIYGTMAKGAVTIDGVPCAFDTVTGIGLDKQWLTIDGNDYWYENAVRQGLEGRGKEIYDPASDAWYWLDSIDQGKKAVSKDVYQESDAGQWADRADGTGKWVRYDANGHMIKGWSTNANGTYYFDLIYGTMAKGEATIDGRTYYFDPNTGILK